MSSISNYSVLNSYEYDGKPVWLDRLDWWSTPLRRVLGGKNCYIMKMQSAYEMSTAWKVITAVGSLVIFPIAVVSTCSLLAKLGYVYLTNERKKVTEIYAKTNRALCEIEEAFNQLDVKRALEALQERPDLADRDDVNDQVFKIVNKRLNEGCKWEEIHPLMGHLRNEQGAALIDHAIKLRFQKEAQTGSPRLSMDEIENFVKNCFANRRYPRYAIRDCYDKIINNSLKITEVTEETPLQNLQKLVIADQMLQKIYAIDVCMMDKDSAQLNQQCYRLRVVPLKFHEYYLIFTDTNRSTLKDLENDIHYNCVINNAIENMFDKLNQCVSSSLKPKEQLDAMKKEINILRNSLAELPYLGIETELHTSLLECFKANNNLYDLIFVGRTEAEEEEVQKKIYEANEKFTSQLKIGVSNPQNSEKNILLHALRCQRFLVIGQAMTEYVVTLQKLNENIKNERAAA